MHVYVPRDVWSRLYEVLGVEPEQPVSALFNKVLELKKYAPPEMGDEVCLREFETVRGTIVGLHGTYAWVYLSDDSYKVYKHSVLRRI